MKHLFKHKHPLRLIFDRSFSKGFGKQLLWLLAFVVVVFVFLLLVSYIAGAYTTGTEDSHGRLIDILFVLVDPGSGASSMSAPFVIMCAVMGLIVFTGMLISVISNVLERRVESYAKGENNYNVSDHVVVLGFNKSVSSLLEKIHKDHAESYIILMTEQEIEKVRDWIHAQIKEDLEKRLILMRGSRNSEDNLERLCLGNDVKEIYILGEAEEPDHDAISLACTKKVAKMLKKDGNVVCHVQIDSSTVFSALQSVDFGDEKTENGAVIKERMQFAPFNMNEICVQKAIATMPQIQNGEYKYRPLDGDGITADSDKHVHLIIVGMDDMSRALAVNAAHILHFPNYRDGEFDTCSHITFIDTDAFKKGKIFRNQYRTLFELARWREVSSDECMEKESGWVDPFAAENNKYKHLGEVNFLDIVWEFIDGDVFDDNMQEYLMRCANNEMEVTTIAICGDDSRLNAKLCMALPDTLCEKANSIIVRQQESEVAVEIISKMPNKKGGHIKPFGMTYECYTENLMSDRYGKFINACYNEIDINNNTEVENAWSRCHILEKWSSNYSANMFYVKLRSLGIVKNITEESLDCEKWADETKERVQYTEHNRWNTERLLLGFKSMTEEEQKRFTEIADLKAKKEKRKEEWKNSKKHLDIVSNKRLIDVDKGVTKFDRYVNGRLWDLYCKIDESNKKS